MRSYVFSFTSPGDMLASHGRAGRWEVYRLAAEYVWSTSGIVPDLED
jgi:hypothetical protein